MVPLMGRLPWLGVAAEDFLQPFHRDRFALPNRLVTVVALNSEL